VLQEFRIAHPIAAGRRSSPAPAGEAGFSDPAHDRELERCERPPAAQPDDRPLALERAFVPGEGCPHTDRPPPSIAITSIRDPRRAYSRFVKSPPRLR